LIELSKREVLDLPLFPEYREEAIGNTFCLESSIHIHFNKENTVKVYKYPVLTFNPINRKQRKEYIKKLHILCLTYSKYLVVREELVKDLPLIATLYKVDEDFDNQIHNQYP